MNNETSSQHVAMEIPSKDGSFKLYDLLVTSDDLSSISNSNKNLKKVTKGVQMFGGNCEKENKTQKKTTKAIVAEDNVGRDDCDIDIEMIRSSNKNYKSLLVDNDDIYSSTQDMFGQSYSWSSSDLRPEDNDDANDNNNQNNSDHNFQQSADWDDSIVHLSLEQEDEESVEELFMDDSFYYQEILEKIGDNLPTSQVPSCKEESITEENDKSSKGVETLSVVIGSAVETAQKMLSNLGETTTSKTVQSEKVVEEANCHSMNEGNYESSDEQLHPSHRHSEFLYNAQQDTEDNRDGNESSKSSEFNVLESKNSEVKGSNFWGREKEIARLEKELFIGSVSHETKQSKHIWVSGQSSGVGKTSLVNEFIRRLPAQTIVCRGSFDTFAKLEKPYNGFVSCFGELFEALLSNKNNEDWKGRIQLSLGRELKLVSLLVPSLSILLGENHEVSKDFDQSDIYCVARLRRALGLLLENICEYLNVVFFVDDLHCASDDSLALVEYILSTVESNNFLFVGCHRAVKLSHPLQKMKAKISNRFATDIILGNLDHETTKHLIRYQLCNIDDRVVAGEDFLQSFAKCLIRNDATNPLYVIQLICFLNEKYTLKLEGNQWISHLDSSARSTTIDLINERIALLSDDDKLVLRGAAFIGSRYFRVHQLQLALSVVLNPERKDPQCSSLILGQILHSLCRRQFLDYSQKGLYMFKSDTIREAFVSEMTERAKEINTLHCEMAVNIQRNLSDSEEEANLKFLASEHFCRGYLHVEGEDKSLLANLSLKVAEDWMVRAAYSTATQLLQVGIATFDKKNQWKKPYALILKYHLALARCYYCNQDIEKAKSYANAIIANAQTPRDRIGGYDVLISIYQYKHQYEMAKNCVLKALADVWNDNVGTHNVDEKFDKVRKIVNSKTDADLLVMQAMTHKKTSAKMPFLMKLADFSNLCKDYKMQDLAALHMVYLTYQYGSFDQCFTGLAFALCGICVGRRRLHGEAYRYGRLAEMMSQGESPYGRQAIAQYHYAISHWKNPAHSSREPITEICNLSLEAECLDHLSFQTMACMSVLFISGAPLGTADDLFQKYNEINKHCQLPEPWSVTILYDAIQQLKQGAISDLKKKHTGKRATQYSLFFKLVISVFMQDVEEASKLLTKLSTKPDGVWIPFTAFLEGLISSSMVRTGSANDVFFHKKKLTNLVNMLTSWTSKGMNHAAYMANILQAELTIATEQNVSLHQARMLFDQAISSASKVTSIAALANERAGLFFLSVNEEAMASNFLSQAYKLYEEWGAGAKVDQLGREHKNFLQNHSDTVSEWHVKSSMANMGSGRSFKIFRPNSIPSLAYSDYLGNKSSHLPPQKQFSQSLSCIGNSSFSRNTEASFSDSVSSLEAETFGDKPQNSSLCHQLFSDTNNGTGNRNGRRIALQKSISDRLLFPSTRHKSNNRVCLRPVMQKTASERFAFPKTPESDYRVHERLAIPGTAHADPHDFRADFQRRASLSLSESQKSLSRHSADCAMSNRKLSSNRKLAVDASIPHRSHSASTVLIELNSLDQPAPPQPMNLSEHSSSGSAARRKASMGLQRSKSVPAIKPLPKDKFGNPSMKQTKKHTSKIGQTLSEIKSDLHPKEFFRDMSFKQKPNKHLPNEQQSKAIKCKDAVSEEPKSSQRPKSFVMRIGSWSKQPKNPPIKSKSTEVPTKKMKGNNAALKNSSKDDSDKEDKVFNKDDVSAEESNVASKPQKKVKKTTPKNKVNSNRPLSATQTNEAKQLKQTVEKSQTKKKVSSKVKASAPSKFNSVVKKKKKTPSPVHK